MLLKRAVNDLLILLVFILAACSQNSDESILHQGMANYLQAAKLAQQQAAQHWDQLILGGGVDCQTGLPIPAYFTLTQTQADRYPQALIVRDHLHLGIDALTESSRIWDDMCANSDAIIAPEAANQGYLAARNAGQELELAQAAYNGWNP